LPADEIRAPVTSSRRTAAAKPATEQGGAAVAITSGGYINVLFKDPDASSGRSTRPSPGSHDPVAAKLPAAVAVVP
jgi:hypothetical protein